MARRDGGAARVCPCSAWLLPQDLQTVARVVKDIDHASGTVIAREGEPGVGLFVIVDGTAEVTIGGAKKVSLARGLLRRDRPARRWAPHRHGDRDLRHRDAGSHGVGSGG